MSSFGRSVSGDDAPLIIISHYQFRAPRSPGLTVTVNANVMVAGQEKAQEKALIAKATVIDLVS